MGLVGLLDQVVQCPLCWLQGGWRIETVGHHLVVIRRILDSSAGGVCEGEIFHNTVSQLCEVAVWHIEKCLHQDVADENILAIWGCQISFLHYGKKKIENYSDMCLPDYVLSTLHEEHG